MSSHQGPERGASQPNGWTRGDAAERSRVRLGAVEYLNARPLVYGLDRSSRFSLRFDVPARCADLLHEGGIDVGLIPSIEYLRGDYCIVPGLSIRSRGPVASVALFAARPIANVRSIALDTSSRTSVALVRVLCARVFGIQPALENQPPNLDVMLARADAALIIGDTALLLPEGSAVGAVEKIDLGELWTRSTGLPFVWAFWAGRSGVLDPADVRALQEARDKGVERSDEVAASYFRASQEHIAVGAKYLRDNIQYVLGDDERAGLELFYRYAAEVGAVGRAGNLRFF